MWQAVDEVGTSGLARERFRGALVGLAVGDAVGTSVEFKMPGTFSPVTDMVGGGPHDLPAGAWTDDTSMALCLAESLVERQGFDSVDQLEHDSPSWQLVPGSPIRRWHNSCQSSRIATSSNGSPTPPTGEHGSCSSPARDARESRRR